MKTRSFIGSLIGVASFLLIFSSCTKNMEDVKADQNVAKLTPNGCSTCTGDYISMTTNGQGANPFFWRGGKHDFPKNVAAECKQTFSGTNFTDQKYFVVRVC